MGSRDVAWELVKGCCRVLVVDRLLDGDVLTVPGGEPTPGNPIRPVDPCGWFCSGGVVGSLICPNWESGRDGGVDVPGSGDEN